MGIKAILVGLFCGKSGKDGIWDFLGKWAAGRSQEKLVLAQNDGTLKLIPLLKPGMVVIERGHGWSREIRMPGTVQSSMLLTAVTPSPVITSLTPADREMLSKKPELELPAQTPGPETGPC